MNQLLFENPSIDLERLPGLEELEYQQLEKDYLKVKTITHILVFLMVGIGLGSFIFFNQKTTLAIDIVLVVAWLALAVGSLLFMRKAFNFRKFALREKDVIYRKGFIWKKTVIIPFNRIQHCEINQGPLEKMYNLATLKVYTAGGQSSDMSIPGITFDRATQIKELLVKKINAEDLLN